MTESPTEHVERVKKVMNRRDELIDEVNQLVTRLGPLPLHRGLSMNEGFEAMIACLKSLEGKINTLEHRLEKRC